MKERIMKNVTRIITLILIVVLFGEIIINTNKSYAADNSCDVNLVLSSQEVKKGENVTVDVKVSNIHIGSGILAAVFGLEFDDNVFSLDSQNTNGTNWETEQIVQTENGYYFQISRPDYTASNQDQIIAKLKFTAKNNAQIGNSVIKIKELKLYSDPDEDIEYAFPNDITKNIAIVSEATPQNEVPENLVPENEVPENEVPENKVPENEVQENEVPENDILENKIPQNETPENTTYDPGKKDDTITKDERLPQTGVAEVVGIISLILLIVSAIVFHKKYNDWFGI